MQAKTSVNQSYKMTRSHGFNPKRKNNINLFQNSKPSLANPNITINKANNFSNAKIKNIQTYALLKQDFLINQDQQTKYQIILDYEQTKKSIIMLDQKELFKKAFTNITEVNVKQNSNSQKNEHQANNFFKVFSNSTNFGNIDNLIVYVSNQNQKVSDQIILGEASLFLKKRKQNEKDKELKQSTQNWNSIMKISYEQIFKNKKQNSIFMLSIIGIQSQNILYDQLNFQWIEDAKNQEIEPIPEIRKKRPTLKIFKQTSSIKGSQKNSQHFFPKSKIVAQNLTKQQINSLDDLFDTLAHYHQIKNHISYLYNYDSYQLGQLYQLVQVQVDSDYGSIKNVLQTLSILKLNNYLINQQGPRKCTGLQSLQLRLGMLLKNYIINQSIKYQDKFLNVQLHQSKILLYLSNHFKMNKQSTICLLNQIGRYKLLKEQIRNLTLNLNCTPHDLDSYLYCKHYIQNKKWKKIVQQKSKKFNSSKIQSNSQTFQFQEKKNLNSNSLKLYRQSQKVKTKSFYYPTVSSSERNNLKEFDRLMFGFQKREELKQKLQTKYRSQTSQNGPDFNEIELKDLTKLNQYFKNSSRKHGSYVSCDSDRQRQLKDQKNLTSNQITGKKLLKNQDKWISHRKQQKIQKSIYQQKSQKTNSFKKSIVPPTLQEIYGLKNKKMGIISISSQQKSLQKQSIRLKIGQKTIKNSQKQKQIKQKGLK